MKRISLTLTLLFALLLPVIAAEMTTATVKLPTLQCGMCKRTIETKVTGLEGLQSIVVDVETKTATVVFDPEVTNIESIEKAISAAGYDANEVKADARAQKKLHGCCQPGSHD
jgi:periplasmic mercuric ion binding protein